MLSLPGLAFWRLASDEVAVVFLVSTGSTDLVILLSALPHPGSCGQSSIANFGGVNWVVNVPDGNLETVPADGCIGVVGPIEFLFHVVFVWARDGCCDVGFLHFARDGGIVEGECGWARGVNWNDWYVGSMFFLVSPCQFICVHIELGFKTEVLVLFMIILVSLDVFIGCYNVGGLDSVVDLFRKVKF